MQPRESRSKVTDTFDRLKTALADRYTIVEEVGAGGMATVYLAEDLKLHFARHFPVEPFFASPPRLTSLDTFPS